MVNKCMFIGNLGADPETRQTAGGSVTKFRLAVNERRKNGDEWVDHTEWVRVVCFGKLAENVQKFCQKGKQVYVEGRIQTQKWQDKDGKDQYTTEIIAQEIKFLGGKKEETSGGYSSSGGGYSGGKAETGGGNPSGEDDIPF